jgi:hypothetical protein
VQAAGVDVQVKLVGITAKQDLLVSGNHSAETTGALLQTSPNRWNGRHLPWA